MKLLLVNNFFGPFGGAEKVMWDEANFLIKAGYDVHFFATCRKPYFIEDYENAHFFPTYTDLRRVSLWNKFKTLPKIIYNKQAENCLDRYLHVLKPDLIHIHNLQYHLSPSILAACQRHDIPVVMTLHDNRLICPSATLTDDPNFKGLCNTGNPLLCMQSKCKNGSLPETLASVAEYYMNRHHALYDSIDRFITPSAALLQLMVRAGFPRERFVHINNFVDPSFLEHLCSESDDDGYFLYFGRLSPEKGVQYLLQAFTQLPEIRLKIAGTGPQEQELKMLAQTLNLANVEFLGFQDKAALRQLIAHCRATVLPCNWFENLSLSALESLACARPLIASSVGGLREVLDYGRCGLLVPPADIAHLVRALRRLHENPEEAHHFGQVGRLHVQSNYTIDRHFKQLMSIYECVAKSNVSRTTLVATAVETPV